MDPEFWSKFDWLSPSPSSWWLSTNADPGVCRLFYISLTSAPGSAQVFGNQHIILVQAVRQIINAQTAFLKILISIIQWIQLVPFNAQFVKLHWWCKIRIIYELIQDASYFALHFYTYKVQNTCLPIKPLKAF